MKNVIRDQSSEFRESTVPGWFRITAFGTLITLLLSLSACGFRPLYGEQAKASGESIPADIVIDPIRGREGQLLRVGIEDRINPGGKMPAQPRYRLAITLNKTEQPVVIETDGTIRRYNVNFVSSYQLIDVATGSELAHGMLKRTSSYNVTTNSDFASFISQRDAGERGVQELAEDYRMRLAAYFAGNQK